MSTTIAIWHLFTEKNKFNKTSNCLVFCWVGCRSLFSCSNNNQRIVIYKVLMINLVAMTKSFGVLSFKKKFWTATFTVLTKCSKSKRIRWNNLAISETIYIVKLCWLYSISNNKTQFSYKTIKYIIVILIIRPSTCN